MVLQVGEVGVSRPLPAAVSTSLFPCPAAASALASPAPSSAAEASLPGRFARPFSSWGRISIAPSSYGAARSSSSAALGEAAPWCPAQEGVHLCGLPERRRSLPRLRQLVLPNARSLSLESVIQVRGRPGKLAAMVLRQEADLLWQAGCMPASTATRHAACRPGRPIAGGVVHEPGCGELAHRRQPELWHQVRYSFQARHVPGRSRKRAR
mmetsp:Transcript_56642/g.132354  ORF Transcript_56642/g.132354 Transcript_56642/m.132354 type:complete len:210 (-) Transcript_56642:774-1403(-)